jgi:hypothetical protein
MPLLVDRLFAGRVKPAVLTAPLLSALNDCVTILDVTNVVDYFVESGASPGWRDQITDLPTIKLPFPSMWMEGRIHGRIQVGAMTRSYGEVADFLPERWGVLAQELAIPTAKALWDVMKLKPELMYSADWPEDWAGADVINVFDLWVPDGGGAVTLSSLWVALGEDGQAVSDETIVLDMTRGLEGGLRGELYTGWLLRPISMALSLMHCKNVRLVHQRQEMPDKLRRSFEKEFGHPLVEYYVLAIDPFAKRHANEPTGLGVPHRFHIVRGHFARYTEDAPLFGKHVGLFWIPAHARGNSDLGIVAKDYELKKRREPDLEALGIRRVAEG